MKETLTRHIVVLHDRHTAPDEVFVHSTEASALAHVHARLLFRLTSDIFLDKTEAPDEGYLAVLRLCLKGGRAAIRDALKIWNELQADDDWIRVEEVSYYNRDDIKEFGRQALEDYTEWRGTERRTVTVDLSRWERSRAFQLWSTDSKTLVDRYTMRGFIAEALVPGSAHREWASLPVLVLTEFERKLTPWGITLGDLALRMDENPSFLPSDVKLLAAFGYDLQVKESTP